MFAAPSLIYSLLIVVYGQPNLLFSWAVLVCG